MGALQPGTQKYLKNGKGGNAGALIWGFTVF
jgi:hypothetical protein